MKTEPRSEEGRLQLEVLHDHYKDTFARVREFERSRDRLFLLLIGAFALLAFQASYPAQFVGTIKTVSVAGIEMDLSLIPSATLLCATWVLTLALTLRYCQRALSVERIYPYVHLLEENISPRVGGGNLYCREGNVYNDNYPVLLNLTYYFYVWIFPIIAAVGGLLVIIWEWMGLRYPFPYRLFDLGMMCLMLLCLVCLRIYPVWKNRRSNTANENSSFDDSQREILRTSTPRVSDDQDSRPAA